MPLFTLQQGDCLELFRALPEASVDLVFGSPPYEDARTYGIEFGLHGQAWVDWMVEVFREAVRVSRGLVAMVVEGRTRNYRYSATPALLMADLHRAGIHLRKPPIYKRFGIPGSGGPDWLRNDYEFVICAARPGRLAWSNNVACGHAPKYPPGGAPSHRSQDGERVNSGHKLQTRRKPNGERVRDGLYKPPAKANPGNIINCGAVGGGNMGSKLAHENEAPFPEALAEFFVQTFCPPGGLVLDPFSGSGTTGAAALRHGRRYLGWDLRPSQIELTHRRLGEQAEAAIT